MNQPSPDANFDPRPLLTTALNQTGMLIAGLTPAQADAPTPCSTYDVTGLVGHLQAVVRRIGVVLAGQPFWSVPQELSAADPATWTADWAAGRAATEAVLADDAFLARECAVPWGEVSGASAAASYIGELTVHSWDLAIATGQTDVLDPVLAQETLPAYQAMVPAAPRGGDVPFGPVVPVPPDADDYDRLVAWTGRDPGWRPSAQ